MYYVMCHKGICPNADTAVRIYGSPLAPATSGNCCLVVVDVSATLPLRSFSTQNVHKKNIKVLLLLFTFLLSLPEPNNVHLAENLKTKQES